MSASIHPAPLMLGPYELLQRIATGGMAEVYLARRAGPHGFQKVVAVKRILPQLAQDADFVAMFVDEARVCARLAHPNIVQVFDFGEHDGELYMAMEYVDGTTAARLVRAAASRGEEVPLDAALYIALSVLRGLDYAHNARDDEGKPLDLVHRDVSPGNVLIDRSGAVKLTDFGIARAAEIERRTDAGQLKGKLGYMSPEQVVGRELDARSDLFTVGIALAELVMLRPLFSGPSEIDVLMRIRDADLGVLDRAGSRVPDDVRTVLFRALARDRALRYPSAAAFAEGIEEILRRRRLQVGPAKLAAWVEKLGLVTNADGDEPQSETSIRQTANLGAAAAAATALAGDASRRPTMPPSSGGAVQTPRSPSVPPASLEPREVSPPIYRVKMPAGPVLGPLSYPRLVELFVTGGIDHRAQISRESGQFRDASSFTELDRFVSSAALRWDDGVFCASNDAGPIDRVMMPSRMFHLALRRDTGALHFRDGAKKKKIYLVEGVPEFVMSTDKRELFGEHLVARGQVLRMEVEMGLAMLPRYAGRLGDALCGLGVLRPIELFRAIAQQTQDRFIEIFQWRKGEVAFVRGARSHEETFPLGMDPFELVLRAIREHYTGAELEAILSPLEEDPIVPVVPLPVRIEAFRFGDAEENVLKRIKEPALIADIVRASRKYATREETHRAIFCGLSCDLLRSERWQAFTAVPLT
ncbi:MAG: eukaryotic-like serine/threonine-protein kinase [Myxococcales bacterium]|jgi:serine/threonine-protein kinase|nr:eukaryotic-like serine/threonine-protein kinase [Myxococcales bacterium]